MGENILSTNENSAQGGHSEAIEFLKKLRSPPWILLAISPIETTGSKIILTETVSTVEQANAFLTTHNGKRNLYYSVNPTFKAMNKKPKKVDISAIEYELADLDPLDHEEPEAAKVRYLRQLNNGFEPRPTAIVDSGNGIQLLWKLAQPMALGNGGGDSIIADAEARSARLMVALGAKAGTQNIDRILRIPGTTNLPNAVKAKKGRQPCQARLLVWTDVSYPITALGIVAEKRGQKEAGIDVDALPVSDRIKDLIRGISDPEHAYASRSEAVFAVVMAMISAHCRDQQVQDVMFDRSLPIGEHVRDQPHPVDYLVRQIRHALPNSAGRAPLCAKLRSRPAWRTSSKGPRRYGKRGLILCGGSCRSICLKDLPCWREDPRSASHGKPSTSPLACPMAGCA
jgi:hypothetical protein